MHWVDFDSVPTDNGTVNGTDAALRSWNFRHRRMPPFHKCWMVKPLLQHTMVNQQVSRAICRNCRGTNHDESRPRGVNAPEPPAKTTISAPIDQPGRQTDLTIATNCTGRRLTQGVPETIRFHHNCYSQAKLNANIVYACGWGSLGRSRSEHSKPRRALP